MGGVVHFEGFRWALRGTHLGFPGNPLDVWSVCSHAHQRRSLRPHLLGSSEAAGSVESCRQACQELYHRKRGLQDQQKGNFSHSLRWACERVTGGEKVVRPVGGWIWLRSSWAVVKPRKVCLCSILLKRKAFRCHSTCTLCNDKKLNRILLYIPCFTQSTKLCKWKVTWGLYSYRPHLSLEGHNMELWNVKRVQACYQRGSQEDVLIVLSGVFVHDLNSPPQNVVF